MESNRTPQPTAFDRYERRVWAGRAAAYAGSFGAICAYPARALLDAAGVGAGTRMLDVGTGPGTVAARAVDRGAVVTAVDAESSMVELAARAVPAADVRQALLPELPFDDASFDAAVANFVVNHLGRPRAGIAELRRVVRPGGRVAVTVWPQPHSAMQRLWGDVLAAAGLALPDDIPTVAEEDNFPRTADGLAGLLDDAGLTEVTGQVISWVHRTDPERWWLGPVNGFGLLGRVVPRLAPADAVEVKRHYDRLASEYVRPDGSLALPTEAVLAAGRVG